MGVTLGWVSPKPVTPITATNRTDELRLLGNGVVPQTATKAFSTLLKKNKQHQLLMQKTLQVDTPPLLWQK